MAAVSLLKLFKYFNWLLFSITNDSRKKKRGVHGNTLLVFTAPGIFCCIEEAGSHLYDKGLFLELIFS